MPKDIPRHIPIPIPAMLFNEFMKTTLQSIAAIIPIVTPIITFLIFISFILSFPILLCDYDFSFRIQKRCNTGSKSGVPTKVINPSLLIYKDLTNSFIFKPTSVSECNFKSFFFLCHVYFSFFQALNTDFYFCFHSIVYGGCLLSFWNIDDFVTGVKFFSPAVSHFISDIFTIPIQLTIIKNVRLPAKARNHIHLHQGDMTEK